MTLTEILVIMQHRIIALNEARKAASLAGDLEKVTQIDADLTTTATTIDKIKDSISLTPT